MKKLVKITSIISTSVICLLPNSKLSGYRSSEEYVTQHIQKERELIINTLLWVKDEEIKAEMLRRLNKLN